jgi:hypothetical protein
MPQVVESPIDCNYYSLMMKTVRVKKEKEKEKGKEKEDETKWW